MGDNQCLWLTKKRTCTGACNLKCLHAPVEYYMHSVQVHLNCSKCKVNSTSKVPVCQTYETYTKLCIVYIIILCSSLFKLVVTPFIILGLMMMMMLRMLMMNQKNRTVKRTCFEMINTLFFWTHLFVFSAVCWHILYNNYLKSSLVNFGWPPPLLVDVICERSLTATTVSVLFVDIEYITTLLVQHVCKF